MQGVARTSSKFFSVAGKRVCLGVLPLLFGMSGCGSREPENLEFPASVLNLKKIYSAYYRASEKNQRPPANVQELMPFLTESGENPEEVLRSPEDGEPYVIFWGVNVRQTPEPILAYEKTGKNGTRYVLLGRRVLSYTDQELREAPFPPGQKPP